MRFQGWGLRAAVAAIVVSTCVPAVGGASAPVDWIFASMTVSGVAPAKTSPGRSSFSIGGPGGDSASISVDISGHATGAGPVLVGAGAGFGDGPSFLSVDDFANGGERLRSTSDLGGLDVEITPSSDGSFRISSSVGGSASSFVDLLFVTNAIIDSYTVKGSHGTPIFETGAGSRVIEMAGPEASGFAVDAGVAALGASTFEATTSKGIVGGVVFGGCVRCTVTWTDPNGRSGSGTQTSTPFVPLPLPVPVPAGGTFDGDSDFAGPAGAWSWSWTGANVRTEPSPTVVGAYAPVGDLWKVFAGHGAGAVVPARPTQSRQSTTHVLGTKQSKGALAATGVATVGWAWVFLLGALLLGRRLSAVR
jgi:hypothetical protein